MARVRSVYPAGGVVTGGGEDDPPERGAWPSAADRALVWLFRLTGHTGGPGWPARLYALGLYIALTLGDCYVVFALAHGGIAALAVGKTFLQAAFSSYFFGLLQGLSWVPTTCTLLSGRRRYAALLSHAQELMAEIADQSDFSALHRAMRRQSAVMLASVLLIIVAVCGLLVYMLWPAFVKMCAPASAHCAFALVMFVVTGTLQISLFMTSVKFIYISLLLDSGLGGVSAAVRALAAGGGRLDDWRRLERLRLLQVRLGAAHGRLTADMAPELVLCMSWGTVAQVATFLVLCLAADGGALVSQLPVLVNMLIGAALLVSGPCEVTQRALDRAADTRAALLQLRWTEPRAGQEVGHFLEAVRHDLDHLGDLGYFSLRRSTVIGITSTVITYIIVCIQFRSSEQVA